MEFHPQDILFPAILGSTAVDFRAIQLNLDSLIANSFAKYFVANSRTSYANFRLELRKRIFDTYELLEQYSTNKVSN